MSQWARNNPEAMREIASLPLAEQVTALRGHIPVRTQRKTPGAVGANDSRVQAVEAILRHQFPERTPGHFRVVAEDIVRALERLDVKALISKDR